MARDWKLKHVPQIIEHNSSTTATNRNSRDREFALADCAESYILRQQRGSGSVSRPQ